jgi:hypothetical protein
MLQDGDLDQSQYAGIHSGSWYCNIEENADIETFVITEGNTTQTAL